MTIFIDTEAINDAYRDMQARKIAYAEALQVSSNADTELERTKSIALANGTIQGKNDTERKAAIAVLFEVEIANLAILENKTAQERLSLDLAEIEVKRVETLVRWLK